MSQIDTSSDKDIKICDLGEDGGDDFAQIGLEVLYLSMIMVLNNFLPAFENFSEYDY